MAKARTAKDVFEKWRALQGIETKSEFATLLGMSKQQYNNIFNLGYSVSAKELSSLAIRHAGSWISECAVEVMRVQGDEELIPCVCLENIGDNGPCPRHGSALQVTGNKLQVQEAA